MILFVGTLSIDTTACSPQSLLTGMNKFLKQLEITFRRDPNNFRLDRIRIEYNLIGLNFNTIETGNRVQ